MKSVYSALLAAISMAALSAVAGEGPAPAPGPVPATPKEKVSYSIGADMGRQLKSIAEEVDVTVLFNGLKDAMAGKTALTDVEMRETMMAWQKDMIGKQAEKQTTYLEVNKKKEGVVTLPSGLQYKVIKEGTGEIPKDGDTVTTHYRGRLIDGTEFDSSYSRNEPTLFPVNGVIPGWTEALKLMKTGSKWELCIPSKLAYGERGMGGKIGPNMTLVFEIELLAIKKAGQ